MKSFAKACLISTIGYQTVEAGWLSCKISDYRVYLKGFAQGFQQDIYNVNTDCFKQVDRFETKIGKFFNSFYEYTWENWLAPVYLFEENLVEMSDTFTACQTSNFAKQLFTRTTSWGGLIEMVTTIGVSFLKDLAQPGGSALYNAGNTFISTNSCARTARSVGEMLHYVVNVNTADAVYFQQLNFQLESQIL